MWTHFWTVTALHCLFISNQRERVYELTWERWRPRNSVSRTPHASASSCRQWRCLCSMAIHNKGRSGGLFCIWRKPDAGSLVFCTTLVPLTLWVNPGLVAKNHIHIVAPRRWSLVTVTPTPTSDAVWVRVRACERNGREHCATQHVASKAPRPRHISHFYVDPRERG